MKQNQDLQSETILAALTKQSYYKKMSEPSPQSWWCSGSSYEAAAETLGCLWAVAVTGKSHERKGSCVSCTWIPCAPLADKIIWTAKQTCRALLP